VILGLYYHGNTAVHTPLVPTINSAVALWAFGHLYKNGTLVTDNAMVHVMLLSRTRRDGDFALACWDCSKNKATSYSSKSCGRASRSSTRRAVSVCQLGTVQLAQAGELRRIANAFTHSNRRLHRARVARGLQRPQPRAAPYGGEAVRAGTRSRRRPRGGGHHRPGIQFVSSHNGSQPAVDTIEVGASITWTWTGSLSHSVQSVGSSSFASSTTKTGSGTYAVTFTAPGTYHYDCAVHGAAMTGTFVVQ